jgi:fluoride exporter
MNQQPNQPSPIRQTPARITALIVVGSGVGGSARVLVSALVDSQGMPLELATLLVNVLGSLLMGLIFALSQQGGRWAQVDQAWLQFLMPGVCAGFTTFSIFSLETLLLIEASAWSAALGNVLLTLLLCLLAVAAGYWLGRRGRH